MKAKRGKVSEPMPVQVYLSGEDRVRLDRLAGHLDATKADVMRQALRALEERLRDPAGHPLLRLAGSARDRGPEGGPDPAVEHDRVIAGE